MKKIDLSKWERAEHFKFYQHFEDPNFNLITSVDTHTLYADAKAANISFTDSYLYCLSQALQSCDFMRFRIVDQQPMDVEKVAISSTFLAEDKTFRFILLDDANTIDEFAAKNKVKKQRGLGKPLLSDDFLSYSGNVDLVFVSILPWFDLSGFKHARHNGDNLGIPKIVFGKFNIEENRLPVSVEVHHGLVDGYHLSLFLNEFSLNIIALCEYLQSKNNFRS
ncbi:CatA-like O-acetyltransferase [Pseudoalteromonas luteoviolacea]|uniref:CatA-like O-acetyltransferase n=1 Tax=Pseudoalteromonas luteoviolacea TaxID=43657 RepID=UPI001F2236F4|nr:CatA-like O-acetyltransferase [Pseudoalteromonas luteoviolacea]MCF6442083.1 CatA-like O-acetyltransferase [Pseudoalteromonas luteoviolacea]